MNPDSLETWRNHYAAEYSNFRKTGAAAAAAAAVVVVVDTVVVDVNCC